VLFNHSNQPANQPTHLSKYRCFTRQLSLMLALMSPLGAIAPPAIAAQPAPASMIEPDASSPSKKEAPTLIACATCGCSELCPITLLDSSNLSSSSLTESIWGNIILKLAYQRDPELQKLSKKLNISNIASINALASIAGGTIGQNVASMACLNPPSGIEDSYAPGTAGLALATVTNVVFGARTVVNHGFRKKMKERQLVIRQQVERLLEHLEYSKTDCSEAQGELATLIGERASKECLQLWQSSHLATTEPPANTAQPVSDDSQIKSTTEIGMVAN
jgi:hypothetical protein